MQYKILTIDRHAQHRQVLRHMIEKIFPDVHLEEYDPQIQGEPVMVNWKDYELLIIDNLQGEDNGIDWFERYRSEAGFPTTVFMSSHKTPEDMKMSRDVIRAMKLGAEDFFFKRTIRSKQLVRLVSTVLESHGYESPLKKTAEMYVKDVLKNIPDEEYESEKKVSEPVQDLSPTDQLELATRHTQHEINLAMAMLHGAEEWPFDFKDILAGKATIGGYNIISYIDKGQHATTFKAVKEGESEKVLLKLLTFKAASAQDVSQASTQDLSDILTWNHPNIIRWLDYQVIDFRLIVTQEILHGETLADRLSRRGVTEEEAIKYFLQLMSALQKIHSAGFYVSDIRPDKLVFRDENTPVITDIGAFRRLHAMSNISEVPAVDEPAYCSPERAQGHTEDSRSDLYLMGVILYEMLAGKPPFNSGSVNDILYSHVSDDIPRLPDTKRPLNMVIQELLMKTPSRRIQTADEAIKRIKSIVVRNQK